MTYWKTRDTLMCRLIRSICRVQQSKYQQNPPLPFLSQSTQASEQWQFALTEASWHQHSRLHTTLWQSPIQKGLRGLGAFSAQIAKQAVWDQRAPGRCIHIASATSLMNSDGRLINDEQLHHSRKKPTLCSGSSLPTDLPLPQISSDRHSQLLK